VEQVPLRAGAAVRCDWLGRRKIALLLLVLMERLFLLGADEQGALGCGLAYANLTSTATPRLVSNLTNASAIFCGALFNCALLKSGTLT
jgi:hypothetical protein